MPYITVADREKLKKPFAVPQTPGELNYLITQLCREYVFWKAPAPNYEPKYENYNDVIGALECAKQEFYRRAIVPYEDHKIEENTDVYVAIQSYSQHGVSNVGLPKDEGQAGEGRTISLAGSFDQTHPSITARGGSGGSN